MFSAQIRIGKRWKNFLFYEVGVNTLLSAAVNRDNVFLEKLYRKSDFLKSLQNSSVALLFISDEIR
jgi:hypothetical protein